MIWRLTIGALIALALSVGGWTANRAAQSVPRNEYNQHVYNADEKFDAVQNELKEQRNRVEDKLDDIQKYIMTHNE
jgi:peptidoglycan hydrolase CwlO-like protein